MTSDIADVSRFQAERALDAMRQEIAEGPENWPYVFQPTTNLSRDLDALVKCAGCIPAIRKIYTKNQTRPPGWAAKSLGINGG